MIGAPMVGVLMPDRLSRKVSAGKGDSPEFDLVTG
jgi:hypothetical protein